MPPSYSGFGSDRIPAVHATQAVWVSVGDCPPGQASQASMPPPDALNFPAAHGTHAVLFSAGSAPPPQAVQAPPVPAEPGGHATQVDCLSFGSS
eukprot:SAG22_NODE_4201_length_1348_cov_1.243395_3_plen_93_part_01